MRKRSIIKSLVFAIITLMTASAFAQVFADKSVGKKQQAQVDSLKASEYPYLLPFLGEKAQQAGFDLPYSAGLGVNYFWQDSDIIINNLFVGFNNGEMYNLDEIIQFSNTTARSNILNFRPDIWILPFLNVYGIIARSKTSTTVDFGIYVPGNEGSEEVISIETKAEFEAVSTGFGVTPTIGVGGGWMAFDMNFTWHDIDELDEPAFSFVFGPRMGKSFSFKKPESNLSIWVGGFRVKINSGTSGSLPLSEFFSTDGIEEKIDNGYTKVGDAQIENDNWWNGLTPMEQNNPVNAARYQTTNKALERAGNFLNGLSNAVILLNDSSVQYKLDKRQKNMWNLITGVQYQYNKHWMIRAEYGLLGSRNQFMAGLQYRFGL